MLHGEQQRLLAPLEQLAADEAAHGGVRARAGDAAELELHRHVGGPAVEVDLQLELVVPSVAERVSRRRRPAVLPRAANLWLAEDAVGDAAEGRTALRRRSRQPERELRLARRAAALADDLRVPAALERERRRPVEGEVHLLAVEPLVDVDRELEAASDSALAPLGQAAAVERRARRSH